MVKPLYKLTTFLVMTAVLLAPLRASMASMPATQHTNGMSMVQDYVIPGTVSHTSQPDDRGTADSQSSHHDCSVSHGTCPACAHCCIFLPAQAMLPDSGHISYLPVTHIKTAALVVAPHFRPPQLLFS